MDRGRRDAARTESAAAEPPAPAFVSLGVVAHEAQTGGPVLRLPAAEVPPRSAPSPTTAALQRCCGTIEIELADGTRIRIDALVDAAALRQVLGVLKGFA